MRLIGKWLNAGVMEDGREVALLSGTPQGGVISPLLSRSLLLRLKPLTDEDIGGLIDRAVTDQRGLDGNHAFERQVRRPDSRRMTSSSPAWSWPWPPCPSRTPPRAPC